MKILNYSFFETNEFELVNVYDNESFFNEVVFKKYDVLIVDFNNFLDVEKIKNNFEGYIIFLNDFCDDLYYKKALEIGDFCYVYVEQKKIILRLRYLKNKILKKEVVKFGGFIYNFKTKNLYYKTELVSLTKAENEIINFLLKNNGKFVSSIEIIENCDYIDNIDSIKVIISKLRKKGIPIENKKNVGYKINIKEQK